MSPHDIVQVVTVSSSPVVRTKTELVTNTLEILLAPGRASLTTLVTPHVTTVTELSPVTTTLAIPGVPPPGLHTTIVSSPVTYSTSITQTQTGDNNMGSHSIVLSCSESYRVIFRARPITTTVVSTRVVPTVLTSFATQTLTLPPSILNLG